jgi:hypothetical protein
MWYLIGKLYRRSTCQLLVLGAFKGNITPEVKSVIYAVKTDLVIPGGMTFQLQVLDVVVDKPFKNHLK